MLKTVQFIKEQIQLMPSHQGTFDDYIYVLYSDNHIFRLIFIDYAIIVEDGHIKVKLVGTDHTIIVISQDDIIQGDPTQTQQQWIIWKIIRKRITNMILSARCNIKVLKIPLLGSVVIFLRYFVKTGIVSKELLTSEQLKCAKMTCELLE